MTDSELEMADSEFEDVEDYVFTDAVEEIPPQDSAESIDIYSQEPQVSDLSEASVPVPRFELDTDQPLEDQAKDYLMAVATVSAVKDEETREAVLQKKSEEMVTHAEVRRKQEEAQERQAEADLQTARQKVNDAVVKNAGIMSTLPTWMQKSLYPALGAIQWLLYFILGAVSSLISIVLDIIKIISDKFSALAISARKLFWSLFFISIVLLAVYVVALFLERAGIFILPWRG